MRDIIFLDCGQGAGRKAEAWATEALRRAGFAPSDADREADRLAETIRATARGFDVSAPQAMLLLSDEDGPLRFELVADAGSAPKAPCCATERPSEVRCAWDDAERRVAGDGSTCLRMIARA